MTLADSPSPLRPSEADGLRPRVSKPDSRWLAPCCSSNSESRTAHPGARGFTLIEILVVVMIVGVLAAAVVIAIGRSGERRVADAAEAFRARYAHACATAELTGRDIGLRIEDTGYSFLRLERNGWQALTHDDALRTRAWPGGVGIEWAHRERPDPRDDQMDAVSRQPQIVCFASGEATPFELMLAAGDPPVRYRIDSDGDPHGRVMRMESAP